MQVADTVVVAETEWGRTCNSFICRVMELWMRKRGPSAVVPTAELDPSLCFSALQLEKASV